jgi:TRAP-type C4-dicarboxylate transport system substrate-binding protein
MQKKILLGLLTVTFIALLLAGWTSPALSAPTKISLGFATIWNMKHYTSTDQIPRYFKMVEKAANGKYALDIKWYPVGTLLGGSEIYDGVVKGIVDSGVSSFGYTPGRFPVIMTLNQAGIAPPLNSDAAARTVWQFYYQLKPKELDEVKVLYLFATGPGWLHTKKPVHTVAEMKGLKIRCTGGGVLGVKAVGGDPVSMPMGDVYLAAQKGVVNALVSPLETLEGWKHHEVFEYSTFVPEFYSEFMHVTMNKTKWNSLPKDLQDAFNSVTVDAVNEAGQIWEYQQKHGMDFAKKSQGGHEFIYLPAEEVAKLKKLCEPVEGQYIDLLNSKGLPGKEIVKLAAEIMAKNNKLKYDPWKP